MQLVTIFVILGHDLFRLSLLEVLVHCAQLNSIRSQTDYLDLNAHFRFQNVQVLSYMC